MKHKDSYLAFISLFQGTVQLCPCAGSPCVLLRVCYRQQLSSSSLLCITVILLDIVHQYIMLDCPYQYIIRSSSRCQNVAVGISANNKTFKHDNHICTVTMFPSAKGAAPFAERFSAWRIRSPLWSSSMSADKNIMAKISSHLISFCMSTLSCQQGAPSGKNIAPHPCSGCDISQSLDSCKFNQGSADMLLPMLGKPHRKLVGSETNCLRIWYSWYVLFLDKAIISSAQAFADFLR